MSDFQRVFGSVALNTFLTTALWLVSTYIYISNYSAEQPVDFSDAGPGFALFMVGVTGVMAGSFLGGMTFFLNTPPVLSGLIGFGLCFAGLLFFAGWGSSLIFITVSSLLAAITAALSARFFNTPGVSR